MKNGFPEIIGGGAGAFENYSISVLLGVPKKETQEHVLGFVNNNIDKWRGSSGMQCLENTCEILIRLMKRDGKIFLQGNGVATIFEQMVVFH